MVRRTDGDLSDAALLASVAEREPGAFDELFRRHAPSVARLARAATRRSEDAEDVVQNVFLSAHRHARSFRNEASVRTWLLTIARNEAYRVRDKESRHQPARPLEELGALAGWGSTTPEALLIAVERAGAVRAALDAMPPEAREVIVLRDLEGLSGQETADILGLSLAATKSRLHRARLELAGRLRRGVS